MEYSEEGQNDWRKLIEQEEALEENNGSDAKKPEDEDEKEDPQDAFVVKTKEDFISSTLKKLLKLWEATLQERSDLVKKTQAGRLETLTFKQTKNYIKPLLKLLKSRSLAEDLRNPIHDMCMFIGEREYVKAHDAYLRMAIGNAAWPMGVTMVGIHERSSREKIFSNQTAHVLNDETQRKYIQSIKRLMTFAQKMFPTDPSKMVQS